MGMTFTTEPLQGRKARLEQNLVVVKVGTRRKTRWGQVTGSRGGSRFMTGEGKRDLHQT